MSESTTKPRRRHKAKPNLDPITWDEIVSQPGMGGYLSFLEPPKPVPHLLGVDEQSSAPETSAPVSEPSAPHTSAVDSSAVVSPALVSAAVAIDAPETGAGETGAPDLSAPGSSALIPSAGESSASESKAGALEIGAPETSALVLRRHRIREATTVQDGHTFGEQAVYDAMYRAGKPYHGDARIITIGLRTLAEMSRLAYSNCKANVHSLLAKLAIEERGTFSYTAGRTYVVYSFREILQRRKSAGMTHVIRTRSVVFVDPATGVPLDQTSAPETSALVSHSSAPQSLKVSALVSGESSAPESVAHIRNRDSARNTTEESSSSVIEALRMHAAEVDDDACCQLITECRRRAPDATDEEIVHFVRAKGGQPGIRRPLGFLLTAVPRCFEGESFRQFRAEQERSREGLRLAQGRYREQARAVLEDPSAPEDEKQWAREMLTD